MKLLLISVFFLSIFAPKSVLAEGYIIEWSIAHSPNEYFEWPAKRFKELVDSQKIQNLKIIVRNESSNQFLQQLKNTEENKVQITQVFLAQLYQNQENFKVFGLPFIFVSYDHFQSFILSDSAKELLDTTNNSKIIAKEYLLTDSFIHMASSKKPLTNLNGLKMLTYRTFGGEKLDWIQKTLGSKPIPPIDFSKGIYLTLDQMLEQNLTVAGDSGALDAWKAHSVPRKNKITHLLLSGHYLRPSAIIINKDFYNSLPSSIKKVIDKTLKKVAREQRDFVINEEARILKKLKTKGIVISSLNKKEKDRFKELMQPLYKKHEQVISKDLLKRIEAFKR